MKVFIAPTYRHPDSHGDGGIRRVSDALWRYLPDHGIQPVENPEEADLLNLHGASFIDRPGTPIVASCHGLYWSDYVFGLWAHETNRMVVEILARAQAVTVPSEWVRTAVTRGMLVSPTVCYHGVDPDEWRHALPSGGYVLWNKARSDAVSNPDDLNNLAQLMPDVRFISTLGAPMPNVEIAGVVGYDKMRPMVQRAGVYLATARETFGIGTLEALAAGVPVAGWDYGGQSEIILPGETGYLAPHGDYAALAECVRRCLAERRRLSANAVQDVRERWLWPDKVARYAEIFQRAHDEFHAPRPRVSVIVTSHNLGRFLPEALNSLLAQSMADWECLIVDDASTDDTFRVAQEFSERDPRFIYARTPANLKLSGARNYGFSLAHGRYIQCLDADDQLDREALGILARALDDQPHIHIAAGHIDTFNDGNPERSRSVGWPLEAVDYHWQMAHLNQLHYSAMVRREALERGGGYRRRAWRAEDAEMWCRLMSFGFRAKKVTEQSTLVYRFRSDSKSQQELQAHPDRDGDWTAWFPWRIAGNPKDGLRLAKRGAQTPIETTPFGAQGKPPDGAKFWRAPHYAEPEISVIIPVGPGHAPLVIDAVESVMAQTFLNWEVIVVNDTGAAWPEGFDNPLAGAPYARVMQTPGARGAGYARNLGAKAARAPLLVFLDADDYLLPQFLELTLAEFKATGKLVYTDHLITRGDPRVPAELYEMQDWACSAWRTGEDGREHLTGTLNLAYHGTTCLIPRQVFQQVGGFDETMPCWEEWDLFIKLEAAGLCSVRIPRPLFAYRVTKGGRRVYAELRPELRGTPEGERVEANRRHLRQLLKDRYLDYYTGVKTMACGCSGDGVQQSPETIENAAMQAELSRDAALVEYAGDSVGTLTFTPPINPVQSYYFGANDGNRVKYVLNVHVAWFLELNYAGKNLFRLSSQLAAAARAPDAIRAEPGAPADNPLPSMEEYAREARSQIPEPAQGG